MLVRTEAFRKVVAASSVQPSVVRSAEIGTRDNGALGWSDSSTFDASGTEANRVLFLLVELYSTDGSGSTWSLNSLTIGGVAATVDAAAITNTDGGRNATVIIAHQVAPANSATLAVAWDVGISGGDDVTAAKIYGVLLQDVHQTTPIGANVTRTNQAGASVTESLAITTLHELSLLLGGVIGRGGDTHPHSAIDTETILHAAATGTDTILSAGCSVFTKNPGSPGAKTAGVDMSANDHRGGALVEVRAA